MKNSPPKQRTNFHQSNYGSGTLEILNRLYRIENIKYFTDFEFLPSWIILYAVRTGLKLVNRYSDYRVKDRIGKKIIYRRVFARWAKMELIRKVLWLAVLWDKHRFDKNVPKLVVTKVFYNMQINNYLTLGINFEDVIEYGNFERRQENL